MEWPLVGREADLDEALKLVASGRGIAILGPAGVGKSRLLHELVDRAGRNGMAVIRAVASQSTRSIPFAPFVSLLSDGPTQDRLAMLRSARRSLEALTTQYGLLLSVDDAHHLDETSLAFLIGSVEDGVAVAAMTARTGETMKPDLVDLWTNGVISRADLGPLTRAEARHLTESTLGVVSPELEGELWRLARGNPLLLHELLEGARGRSVVQGADGTWTLEGSIAESARLADLVTSRLRALPDEARRALAMVALGSPLPLAVAESIAPSAVGRLEERGLVSVIDFPTDPVVVPAHPLYGEILAANLPESHRRSAYRTLVETSLGAGGGSDPLRLAIWQSRSGSLVSPEIALAGAEEALVRHDPSLAESLARPLGQEDERVSLVLGRALSYQQRFAEAEEILRSKTATESAVAGDLVSIRALNLGFGLGRTDEARGLLASAVGRIEDPAMRARLNNERAMVSAISGDFVDARAASGSVLSDDRSDDVARLAAYVTLTVALAMTGDCDGMEEVVDDALDVGRGNQSALPFAADQIEIMHFSSMLFAGRIDEANNLASQAIGRIDRGSALKATWLSASGWGLGLAGQLERAAASTRSALESYRKADPFGLENQARGMLTFFRAQMGSPDTSAIDDLVRLTPAPRIKVWVDRGRAWAAAAGGDVDTGAGIATSGGSDAVLREHFAWAALCFHDAVRMGRPELSIEELRALDASNGAHLLAVMKRHGEAALDPDPIEMEAVARAFAAKGAPLLAAEVWSEVARLCGGSGAATDAARACAISLAYQHRCEGPDTPALRARPVLVTSREIEVALHAAAGLSSPRIADILFISARTVDNHLSSIYRKLGIGGRDDLVRVLTEPGLDSFDNE